MATEIASLYAKIGADASEFNREMGKAKGEMGAFGKTHDAIGQGLKLAAGVGVAGVALLGKGIYDATMQAADMEQKVADIAAVMGLAKDEIEPLNDLILELGLNPNLKVTAVEAAEAIEMLAKNGLSMTDILGGAAEATVLLANSTGGSFAQSADIATDAMALWNIEAKDMSQVVNGVTGLVQSSKFGIDDYALALAQGGGVAASVGVSFDDFNATLAAISPLFGSGSDAGTSFKVFLQRMVPQSQAAVDAMRDLGLFTGLSGKEFEQTQEKIGKAQAALAKLDPTSKNYAARSKELTDEIAFLNSTLAEGSNKFFDADGNMRSMSEIAGILQDATKDLSDEQKNAAFSTIFGTDAMRAAFAVAESGTEGIDKMREAIGNTSAIDSAKTRMDTFRGALEIASGIVETMTISVGQKFLPVFRDVAEFFIKFMEKNGPAVVGWFGDLADWVGSLPAQFETLRGKVTEFVDKAMTVVQPIIDIVSQFISWNDVIVALGILIGSFVLITLGGLVGAIAPVALVIGGLIGTVALLRTAWETDWGGIQGKTEAAKAYLTERFGALGFTIKEFGAGALRELADWATGNETEFNATKRIWSEAKTAFGNVWTDTKTVLTDWGAGITAWGKEAFAAFAEQFPGAAAKMQEAWDKTKETIDRFWAVVKPLIDKGIKWFNDLVEAWQTGNGEMTKSIEDAKTVIDGVLTILVIAIETFVNNAIDVITMVVQFLSGDFEGAWVTAGGMLKRTVEAWSGIVDVALGMLEDVFGVTLDDIKKIVKGFTDQGYAIVNNLWNGMKDVWNRFSTWFKGEFNKLPEPVKALVRDIYNAGRDIVQGLWDGIKGKWTEFTRWLQEKWEWISSGFRNAQQIQSPSRVFARMGGQLMEGLALGIERGLPQVDAAMADVSSTVNVVGSAVEGGGGGTESDLAAAIRALVATLQQQRSGNQINVTMPGGTGNQSNDLAATVQYLQALYA
jgi:TP901 family phage tail tape measure protein